MSEPTLTNKYVTARFGMEFYTAWSEIECQENFKRPPVRLQRKSKMKLLGVRSRTHTCPHASGVHSAKLLEDFGATLQQQP